MPWTLGDIHVETLRASEDVHIEGENVSSHELDGLDASIVSLNSAKLTQITLLSLEHGHAALIDDDWRRISVYLSGGLDSRSRRHKHRRKQPSTAEL